MNRHALYSAYASEPPMTPSDAFCRNPYAPGFVADQPSDAKALSSASTATTATKQKTNHRPIADMTALPLH